MKRKTIFLTGASGTMGRAGLEQLLERSDRFHVVALVPPTDRDRARMAPFAGEPHLTIVWGDLTDYDDVLRCVTGADIVLHVGGIVSPYADRHPELAMKVNVGAARNLVRAIRAQIAPSLCKLGDLRARLRWRCAFGHEFDASPALVLLGGHWCPRCLPAPWNYAEEAKRNPFLAQVWRNGAFGSAVL